MDKVIDLLTCERERTKRSIKWLKNEIRDRKKAVRELKSPEFIEKHKNSSSARTVKAIDDVWKDYYK